MRHVAVIGAGLMGRALAALAARNGFSVMLHDSDKDVLAASIAAIRADGAAVTGCSSLVDLEAEFITEAIVENLAAKQDLFARLGDLLPDAILASNTSVLPITAIAARTNNPQRVVGTHWWNPPQLIPVVEVIKAEHTSEDTMTATIAILRDMGKTPVRVERDIPGFVGNRLQHALWREAIALIADGVCDAATVDLMVRNTLGLKLGTMGPIENADYVGLDLTLAIHEAVLPSLNRDPHPSPRLKEMVAENRLGAKTGSGFFHWPEGERDRVAARLAAHVKTQADASEKRTSALSDAP